MSPGLIPWLDNGNAVTSIFSTLTNVSVLDDATATSIGPSLLESTLTPSSGTPGLKVLPLVGSNEISAATK